MTLNIHNEIMCKLDKLLEANKVPNIIFHGPCGSGKRILVNTFIQQIYANNKEYMRDSVMDVNCAHGKGIKFVREDIKFFAKTNMKCTEPDSPKFKTILLTNADKLTSDAQSALRRCIELYTHNTRFFIIVEDKYKLLRPILSRFCEIYVPYPNIDNNSINLHQYTIDKCFSFGKKNNKQIQTKLDKILKNSNLDDHYSIVKLAEKLYEKGYCAIDLINYIENISICDKKKYKFILVFHQIKREFRNEKLLMCFIMTFLYLRSEYNLENLTFM